VIVGITGTGGNFDRLVGALADWHRAHPDERVWVQHGGSPLATALDGVDYVPRTELLAKIAEADVVVCHAASGTLVDAIGLGHVPVVLPRLQRFGEVVNDHQLDVLQALARAGRVIPVEDVGGLGEAIEASRGARQKIGPPAGRLALIASLRDELASLSSPGTRRRDWLLRALGAVTSWVPTARHRWP
jgi:UDP-N-acetylglucosamine transferase subunit ALG13